jgi:hypothetical protein
MRNGHFPARIERGEGKMRAIVGDFPLEATYQVVAPDEVEALAVFDDVKVEGRPVERRVRRLFVAKQGEKFVLGISNGGQSLVGAENLDRVMKKWTPEDRRREWETYQMIRIAEFSEKPELIALVAAAGKYHELREVVVRTQGAQVPVEEVLRSIWRKRAAFSRGRVPGRIDFEAHWKKP